MPAYAIVGENGVMYNSIKAFCKFLPSRLPNRIADIYKLHWRPVYQMMEEGIGPIPEHLTTKIVNHLYERGTEHLCRRVSYGFQNDKLCHHDWVIATWARYLSRSMITKKGTEEDRSHLPAPTGFNRCRPVGLKCRKNANGAPASSCRSCSTSSRPSYNRSPAPAAGRCSTKQQ
jgi:hypothetical protein